MGERNFMALLDDKSVGVENTFQSGWFRFRRAFNRFCGAVDSSAG